MTDNDDMQIDAEPSEESLTSQQFVFSKPIESDPRKIINFGTDHVFQSPQPQESIFKFAPPGIVPKNIFGKLSKKLCQAKNQYKPRIDRDAFKPSVDIFTKAIKDTPVFEQLKKNAKSTTVKCRIENSITCTNVPKCLLTRTSAKEYFSIYGQVAKVTIRPKKQIITVYYVSKISANTAFSKCGEVEGQIFQVQWTSSVIPQKTAVKKKESGKSMVKKLLMVDDEDEIKQELEALQNLENNLYGFEEKMEMQEPLVFKMKKTKAVAKDQKKLEKGIVDVDAPMKYIPTATVEELQILIKQQSHTSEEKYKILDARDKLMRLSQTKQFNLETAKVTIGMCPDMCPEKERLMRESQRQVSLYEQLDSNDYKINHMTAVKQYSRSSADQEEPMPHDLRPVRSLKMTMSYLLHEIADLCEKPSTNLAEWYNFLWDRTRGIRKDITQQELCCVESVELVEQCARFHIVCSERLCAEESSVFDKKINTENLTKCLQTLKYMYHDLRVKGIVCKKEPEFQAYIILLNLNNANFMWDLQKLPISVQQSAEVKFAIKVYSAIAENNYAKFFKLVCGTTYLNACILLRYFNQIRVKAVTVMMKAYCRTPSTAFSLYELIDIFGFEDQNEAFFFYEQMGLKVSRDELSIIFNRHSFKLPESNLEQGRSINVIESKRTRYKITIGQCISGGELPEKSYENHIPHNSFDSEGYLLPESLNAGDQELDRSNSTNDPYEFTDDDILDSANSSKEESPKKSSSIKTFSFLEESQEKQETSVFRKSDRLFDSSVSDNLFNKKLNESTTSIPLRIEQSASIMKCEKNSIFAKKNDVFEANKIALPSSVFDRAVNPGIFGGTSKDNIFIKRSTTSSSLWSGSDTVTTMKVPEPASPQKDTPKAEALLEEERRKKLEEKNLEEQRKKAECEKLLKEIEDNTENIFEDLKTEVLRETCTSVIKEELERIEMYITLSNNIYESLLNQFIKESCEETLKRELQIIKTLEEVNSRIRKKTIMKYYHIWKKEVRKRKIQRKALDDTPVWLQRESLEDCAKSLYHPEQKTVISKMCSKRLKMMEEKPTSECQVPIDIIAYSGLKENLKSLDTETIPRLFWKIVISWPCLQNKIALWQQKKVMNKYLNPEDFTVDPILKTFKPNPYETLHMCIRHFEGFIGEDQLTGTDGLLFIAEASEDMKSVEKRLTKTVLSRKKLMPIPLVIFVFGYGDLGRQESWITLNLENLLESGYISEYTISFQNNMDEKRTIRMIQSAILWLVMHKSPVIPLEMDYLKNVLSECLMEELWLRIQGHSSYNPQLTRIFENPNFIINLHNEAVTHLTDIILDPESLMYTDYPPELKKYLSNDIELPCSYEYFDDTWKNTEYRVYLENVMNELILPPWRFTWPAENMVNLKSAIFLYCQEVLSEVNHYSVASAILSNLFLIFENSIKPSFTYILLYIIEEKINHLKNSLKVVYNRNHIKHFRSLPWWFKSTTFTDYVTQKRPLLEIENKHTTMDTLEISEEFSDVEKETNDAFDPNDSFAPLDAFCKEKQDQIKEICSISQQLEMRCDEFNLNTQIMEEKLKKALEA